jgi:hypothetical protein
VETSSDSLDALESPNRLTSALRKVERKISKESIKEEDVDDFESEDGLFSR